MPINMVNDLAFGKIYLITASLGYKAHTITVLRPVALANNIFQTEILKRIAFLNVVYCYVLFSKSASCHRCREVNIEDRPNRTCSSTPFLARQCPFKIWIMFSFREMPSPFKSQTKADHLVFPNDTPGFVAWAARPVKLISCFLPENCPHMARLVVMSEMENV